MNSLNRFGGALITILPSAVPATLLTWKAWITPCYTLPCKTISVVALLTGVVLSLWSVITFTACLLSKPSDQKYSPWKRFRINLLDIVPTILMYATFAGILLYYTVHLFVTNFTAAEYGEKRMLLLAVFFLPVYELTRVITRISSVKEEVMKPIAEEKYQVIEKPVPVELQAMMFLQSLVTFVIWYFVMQQLLENKQHIPFMADYPEWKQLLILGIMAGITWLLLKCFGLIERQLRKNGVIRWNSKYP